MRSRSSPCGRPDENAAAANTPPLNDNGSCSFIQQPLSTQEQRYRKSKLREIEARVQQNGPHIARAHPDRARQFMPFAALKGHQTLIRQKEAEAVRRSS